jgi:predicted DNA-binding protein YlxM (UPF0122 family)
MAESIYYSSLYDYYSPLLTETQRDYFKDYHFNNLSLTEIADNYHVSKNAISKTLKEVVNKLVAFEDSLNLYSNKLAITKILNEETLKKIEEYI